MISPRKRQLNISRRLIVFAIGIIILILGTVLFLLSIGNVISASWSFIVTAAISVFGVLIAALQWFLPLYPSSTPMSIPSRKRLIYHNLEETPPFMESGTTLARKEAVRNIYEMLIQKDVTTVVLTGAGGLGKTWLAALVCDYAEEQRQSGNSPFNTDVLWLKISQDVTMVDLAGTILEAQGQHVADLDSFTPEKQAEVLFGALNIMDKARLIIIDEFDLLLDEQGDIREDRLSISKWMDLIKARPCACKILITSRRELLGAPANRLAFREIQSKGLTTQEGVELLRKQGVRATEGELYKAVESSKDNLLGLTQMASLVREHSLSLDILFDSSRTGSSIQPKRSSKLINILFLAANPKDMSLLKLDDELRDIEVALHQTEFRQRFDIKQQWVVSVADLQGYLIRYTPDIIHFSGHGSPSGQIILEDNTGNNHPISPRALSQIFSILKNAVRCVVLDACYSGQQAQAIVQHVDCVVGISSVINDAAATRFAAAFYQALGYGNSIRTAFEIGFTQISLENLDEQDTPQLLTVNSDSADISLINDNS